MQQRKIIAVDARRGGATFLAGGNRTVPGASHRITLSAPQAVVEVVDEVVTEGTLTAICRFRV